MTLVLVNGTVRTLDERQPFASSVVIEGERIAAVDGRAGDGARNEVDVSGLCVVPGFNDAHVHFPTWALGLGQVRLEGVRSLDEALDRVGAAVEHVPSGTWLRGLGWRETEWSPAVRPTRWDLDRVTGDVPVALMAKDYHSLWVNSAALARANGNLEREGGVVEVDEHGIATGILREESAWHFRDVYARPTLDEMIAACRNALRVANARGVTAVHDKDGWLGAYDVWAALHADEELTLRVWQSFPHDQLASLVERGLRSGAGDDYLRVGYLKAFLDGTLGSGTARLLDGSGVAITSKTEFMEIIRRGAEAGFPVAVHAIGDQANRDALDAFEETEQHWKPQGLRSRIEHAQLLTWEDVPRFAEIGVAASVQFSHAPSDRQLADDLWRGKTDRAYAYRSLLDAGAVLANGSDAPVEELDPLAGIRAGVRRSLDDRPAWHPEQAVTVDEALHATVTGPVWLAGDELRRGRLVAGQLSDLVVLDRDLFGEPEDLLEANVVATLVGGRWVHNPPPW